MEFGYFTLSDNHYPNNPRSANELVLQIREQAILADRTPPPTEAGEVDDAPPLGIESKTLVRRAFVAALFGAFFAPVLAQLYSLYLAKAAFARWPELDRWDKRKLVFAVAFDLVVVGTAAAILWKIKT